MKRRDGRAKSWVLVCYGAGMSVAGYLWGLRPLVEGGKYGNLRTPLDLVSCDNLLTSPRAELAGVPVALLGFVGFALPFSVGAWRLVQEEAGPRWLPCILVAIGALGLAFVLGMSFAEVLGLEMVSP